MLLIKRIVLFIITIVLIIFAIVLSGLNPEKVLLNLYYFKLELSLGFLLIAALFIGLLCGLFLSLFSYYMPLKSKLNKLSRKNKQVLAQQRLLEQNND